MGLSWEDSYLGGLRILAGDERVLISVGAHGVVRDSGGRILLIQRTDNRTWDVPGGTMELGETLRECAIREVREEAGLVVPGVTPFALYTRARDWRPNPYGHRYQYISLMCRADGYHGDLQRVTDESLDADFFALDALPEDTGGLALRALRDLAAFEATGTFALD